MENQDSKWRLWLKRLGVAGFLFFLLKGIAWIVVLVFLKGQLQC